MMSRLLAVVNAVIRAPARGQARTASLSRICAHGEGDNTFYKMASLAHGKYH